MDKASASEAGDCGFESHLGRMMITAGYGTAVYYAVDQVHKYLHSQWIYYEDID